MHANDLVLHMNLLNPTMPCIPLAL